MFGKLIRTSLLAMVIAVAVNCGSTKSDSDGVQADSLSPHRQLSGEIFVPDVSGEAEVKLYIVRTAKAPQQIAETVADKNHRFALELGTSNGPYLIEAHYPGQRYGYRHYVAEHKTGDRLALSPLSTLAASMVDYLVRTRGQEPFGRLVREAEAELSRHFHADALLQTQPDRDILLVADTSLGDNSEARAAILIRSLARLHKKQQTKIDVSRDSFDQFIFTLSEDLASDGIIDGRGPDGSVLKINGFEYGGSLLGYELAYTLLDEVEEQRKIPRDQSQSYCDWARGVADPHSSFVSHFSDPRVEFRCSERQITLHGTVFDYEADAKYQITAYRLNKDGSPSDVLGSIQNSQGSCWTLEIPFVDSGIWVEARYQDTQTPYLRVLLSSEFNGKPFRAVHLHPLSALVSGYAEYLMRNNGLGVEQAVRSSNEQFRAHFSARVDASVKPKEFVIAEHLRSGEKYIDDGQSVSLYNEAFANFCAGRPGRSRAQQGSFAARKNVQDSRQVAAVVRLLVEDVTEDGSFDGRGIDGKILTATSRDLSVHTLKGDLAAEILALREDVLTDETEIAELIQMNETSKRISEITGNLTTDMTGPFGDIESTISAGGPKFLSCREVINAKTYRDLKKTVFGNVEIECQFHSMVGCRAIWVRSQDQRSSLTKLDEGGHAGERSGASDLMFPVTGRIQFTVDTTIELPKDQKRGSRKILFEALDRAGFISHSEIELKINNEDPQLECENCQLDKDGHTKRNRYVKAGEAATFTIIVPDGSETNLSIDSADGNASLTRLFVDDNDQAVWQLTAEGSSRRSRDFTVKAVDRFGRTNTALYRVQSILRQPGFMHPLISQSNDFGLSKEQRNQIRHRFRLSNDAYLTHVYAELLDNTPQRYAWRFKHVDVSRITFRVNNGPDDLPIEKVEYQATAYEDSNFNRVRSGGKEWRPLYASGDGQYEFIVSYQMLLSSEQLRDRDTARRSAYLLHRGATAEEPAPWIVKARVTDILGRQAEMDMRISIDARLPDVRIVRKEYLPSWKNGLEPSLDNRIGHEQGLAEIVVESQDFGIHDGIFRPRPLVPHINGGARLESRAVGRAWLRERLPIYHFDWQAVKLCLNHVYQKGMLSGVYFPSSSTETTHARCLPIQNRGMVWSQSGGFDAVENYDPDAEPVLIASPLRSGSQSTIGAGEIGVISLKIAGRTSHGLQRRRIPGQEIDRWQLWSRVGINFFSADYKDHVDAQMYYEVVERWLFEARPELLLQMEGSLLRPSNWESIFNLVIEHRL